LVANRNLFRRPSVSHLDNDLPLGSTLLEICERFLCLLEWKHLVYHRPDAPRHEKLADLRELPAVRMHKQERILGAAFPCAANYLAAQQPEQEHHEKAHASGASECGVRWPDERDDGAVRLQYPKRFLDRIALECAQHGIV